MEYRDALLTTLRFNQNAIKEILKNIFKERDKIRFYLPEKVYRKVCDYLDHREEMGNERRESLRTTTKATAIVIDSYNDHTENDHHALYKSR